MKKQERVTTFELEVLKDAILDILLTDTSKKSFDNQLIQWEFSNKYKLKEITQLGNKALITLKTPSGIKSFEIKVKESKKGWC